MKDRTKRLSRLGNAVVPQIAQWIGRRILEAEASRLDLDESGPRRSEEWLRALGAQDAIKEELYERAEGGR